MSDEEMLGLFSDVADILDGMRRELSAITTSDTGSDPTDHIADWTRDLREKISALRLGPADSTVSSPGLPRSHGSEPSATISSQSQKEHP